MQSEAERNSGGLLSDVNAELFQDEMSAKAEAMLRTPSQSKFVVKRSLYFEFKGRRTRRGWRLGVYYCAPS